MRALFSTLLLAIVSCAGVDEAPRVAKLEQGVLVFTDAGMRAKGSSLFAHLGSVIVSCPTGGYVAGAPGDDSVWISPLRRRVDPPRISLIELEPFPLACLGANDSLRVLVGGPANAISLFADGGSVQLLGSRVDSFDSAPGAFLAVGGGGGILQIYPNSSTTGPLTNPTFNTTAAVAGLGSSLSWGKTGELLVGNVMSHTAGIYPADTSVDGGRVFISAIALPNPDAISSTNDFGRVVLIGDVLPDTGEEYIVATPSLGRVYVFSGMRLVVTLRGQPSFGASLALEPTSLGGLHALWVGEPAQDRVYRFVGIQAEMFSAPPEGQNTSFGAAIAIDQRGLVAIGAPRYGEPVLGLEIGAVFEAFFDGGSTVGQAGPCDAGASCVLPGCNTGTCVGDVFCQQTRPTGSDCEMGQRCDLINNVCVAVDAGIADAGPVDAGTPDAGAPDAGTADAGFVDAGVPDAGANDAGQVADAGVDEVQVFNTCGCTSGGLPFLFLALALSRVRLRRH